jgi:hypothetical protein
MRISNRMILVMITAAAVLLAGAWAMRGDGRGVMHRLGTAIHGR